MDENNRSTSKLKAADITNFLVSIQYRENQSWQGTIQWLDTGQKIHFRSELELLSLMGSAVQSMQKQDSQMRSWDGLKKTVFV